MATYLVTQATGQQSQWVITHLLAAGLKVHAVVRDLQKVPSILKSPGVTIFQGDSTNFEEIYRAAQGCKGAFLNTYPIPGLEAQQAKTIVEACEKAGVESVVASTTFTTGDKTWWDDSATKEIGLHHYFSSKAEVEDIVRRGDFKSYTILRPAFIHHDYFLPSSLQNFPSLSTHGELDHAYNEDARMNQTDANDIGKYAAEALQNPTKFGGQEIDLSNEALTIQEACDILAKVSGRDVQTRKLAPAELEGAAWAHRFQLWANAKDLSGVSAGAKEVEARFGIPFTPLEAALQRDKASLLEGLPAQ
jgi:uncharacterized protein YbjT (DUF2867 family)